ncbi:MAG: type III-A CRISPR-associated protein Csm2 [Chloroflexi bacterium]|nr:type III-A CRISPR-associated protein Csm2 [Chloroflexota bacterium]
MPQATTSAQNLIDIDTILKEAAEAYCASKWNERNIQDSDKVYRFLTATEIDELQNKWKSEALKKRDAENLAKRQATNVNKKIAEQVTAFLNQKASGTPDMVDLGEAAGLLLAAVEITTTQIMHFLDSVKTLRAGEAKSIDIARLRPQLAYAASKKQALEMLLRMLEPWFAHMRTLDDARLKGVFSDFADFVETVVAFTCRYGKQ